MLKKERKLISKLLFLAMCTSLLPTTSAFAGEENVTNLIQTADSSVSGEGETNSESDFTFEETTGTIKKYIGTDTTVVIPSTINGGLVKSIGTMAFRDCDSLTSVIIPNGVTVIEEGAFLLCSSLTDVTLPSTLKSIGKNAFVGCDFKSITIPDSVTYIGNYAFYYCSSLVSIAIPNSVTNIKELTFGNCKSLVNVTIPDSVTTIGNFAFSDCGFTSITIPDSVRYIGDSAFRNCDNAVFYVKSENKKQLLIYRGIDKSRIILNESVAITSITLSNANLNMIPGNKTALTATVLPSTASNKSVIWKSDNILAATVDENGVVTSTGFGTATIICTAIGGCGQPGTCLVSSISYTEVGENIAQIALYSNGSTGYEWKYIADKEGIIEEVSKNFIRENVPVEIVGCGGTDIWSFKGLKIGSTTVKFEYSQPWVGEAIKTKSFLFTVDSELKVTVKEITDNEVLGNLNSDNKINILDYILLKNYITGNLNSINIQNADINKDTKINIFDLLALKKLIVN